MNKTMILSFAAILGGSFITPAQANYHEEERHNGKLQFNVGWYPDPPHAGEPQQLFLTVWYDGRGIVVSDNDPKNPETHPEDKVDVRLKIQRLQSADPAAQVLEEARVPGKFREIWKGYNYYGMDLTARKAGPIAVVLSGEVNGIKLTNERFVCKRPEDLHREQFDGISCIHERKPPLGTAPLPIPHFKPAVIQK